MRILRMTTRSVHKFRWKIGWSIMFKTFKYNQKKLLLPFSVKLIPVLIGHQIISGSSNISRYKYTSKLILQYLERTRILKFAVCPDRTAIIKMWKDHSISKHIKSVWWTLKMKCNSMYNTNAFWNSWRNVVNMFTPR